MSQYEELTTTMTDQQYLVEALTEMGYKPEVQTEGTALRGYGGVSWNRPVQVIIPREQLRDALAPVGFGRDGSGVFQAVIDDRNGSLALRSRREVADTVQDERRKGAGYGSPGR